MHNLKDTILLNGKLYTVTGNAVMAPVFPLDIVKPAPVKTHSHKKVAHHLKPKHHTTVIHKAKNPRRPAKHATARKPQRARTLMRHIVAKPNKTVAPAAKRLTAQKTDAMPKYYSRLPNAHRLKRAIETPKSRHISRFNHTRRHTVIIKRSMPLAVKSPPSLSGNSQPDEIDRLIRSLAKASS